MKKKLSVLVLAAAMLLVFAACSAQSTATFAPNWQSNALTAYDEKYYEELSYALSFKNGFEEGETGMRIELDEQNSAYTSTLEAVGTQTFDGATYHNLYRLTSTLRVAARFVYTDGEGQATELCKFGGENGDADTIVTEVWFHSLDPSYELQNLQPIRSTRTVYAHTPVSLGSAVHWYNYTVTTVYDAACDNATVTVTDNWGNLSDAERNASDTVYKASYSNTVQLEKLQKNYSVFDNAQLYFIGRGMTFAADSVQTVNVVSEAGAANLNISCSALEARSVKFYLDNMSVDQPVNVAKTTFGMTGTYRGTTQTVYYAQKTEGAVNTFYNLPVYIEEPFEYGIGTMAYTIASAYHGR